MDTCEIYDPFTTTELSFLEPDVEYQASGCFTTGAGESYEYVVGVRLDRYNGVICFLVPELIEDYGYMATGIEVDPGDFEWVFDTVTEVV